MKQDNIYIVVISIAFFVLTCIFNFLPRSTYSALEKRDLKQFPAYSLEDVKSGDFTKNINSWFSDSEPYRDFFMQVSMKQKDLLGITKMGEEKVKFHASVATGKATNNPMDESGDNGREIEGYKNTSTANENAKIANLGIVIVGSGKEVRALMAYGGGAEGGVAYAEAANTYKKAFGSKVNVYSMVIPTAIEFYCPEQAKSCTHSQSATITNIYHHLVKDVQAVNVYTPIGKHAKEPIYLRTDHHWAPLGAYYAAQEFARVAKVPFRTLSSYEKRVVHGYVGSMYGYAHDISLKNAPEDFVFYVPKDVKYTTLYQEYKLDKDYNIQGEGRSFEGQFFVHYRDGSSGAYCTFMGGDAKITTITTSTHNGRRLLILKDSFGNALPGYLFYSFEQIFVVDSRYFAKNMKQYVRENKVTDILFAYNIFNAYSTKVANKLESLLVQ
ncbi:DHHW family protein [Prevotella sp.]